MNGFAYRVAAGAAEPLSPDAALGARADLVWIHLPSTNHVARAWLVETAGLDAFVADALTAAETRPRCNSTGEAALINLRGLSSEQLTSSDPLASVRIHAARGCVYTVTRKPMNAVDAVREAVEQGRIADPGDLIAAFATAITEELDPVVADLGDTLDDCEESLDAANVFELRRTVSEARIGAIGYRRFLAPQRDAIDKLAALPVAWLGDDDRLHLSAAADRAARMAEELESIRERAALIHEALTDLRAEQIDQRTLTISVVAMVFLPLTFLTGLLGMNVDGIPYAEQPWAFAGVVAVCAALALGIALYFIRRHWFRG